MCPLQMRTLLLWGTLFVSTLAFLNGCQDPPPPTAQPTEVVVEPVAQRAFPIYGFYIGRTNASLDVEVRARVNGFIEEITFTEGSPVKKGDLLYRIDNRPYLARVKRLKASSLMVNSR